jgi:ABC-2 type transport system ATP-binding protein
VTYPSGVGSPARSASSSAIRVDGLTKRFGRVVAVEDLSMTVPPGEVFGFLGPNGAGKSTTIRLLLGLLRPSAGSAEIFGCAAADVRRSHRHIAYVPADVALWPGLTGAEILELLGSVGSGVDAAYRDELVERFELELDKPAKTYSTGNRQKVALVAAFATRAPLLVLDEPTSGLDPLMEREFRGCVAQARERGQTVFLSSHQLDEVEAVCDRVAILRAGRLVEVDSIADLRQLRRTVVEVSYRGLQPALEDIEGVSGIERLQGERLRFNLTGPPTAALRALANADITALAMHEPTLEEIFLDYYGAAAS